jgi:hypothetical protein
MRAIKNNNVMYHKVKHRQSTQLNALMPKQLHTHQIQMNARMKNLCNAAEGKLLK